MSLVRLIVAILFLIMAFICALAKDQFIFGAMEWLVASIAVSLLPVAGVVVTKRE